MSTSDALSFLARRYPNASAVDHYNKVAATLDGMENTYIAKYIVDHLMNEFINEVK